MKQEAPMDALDYWRLCDEVSVVQAALLIVGEDPAASQEYIANWQPEKKPKGYDAVKAALLNAIQGKRLPAIVPHGEDERGNDIGPLWDDAMISVDNLRTWLTSREVRTGFFFPLPEGPDYLSDFHPNYSPKLAAAIGAWTAVSGDAELRSGKSVKQALVIWLRQHANEFCLTKEDGNPNEQGIEEVAKIANWGTKGGAPKTPGNG
jgi:hypothetical protein